MDFVRGAIVANIGRQVRESLDAADPIEDLRTAREALLERVALGMVRGARPGWLRRVTAGRRSALAFLAAAAVAMAALALWLRFPISFRVGAAEDPGRLGDVIETAGAEPVALWFSEGSSIVLGSGGRVRVLSAEPTGARVLIEDGVIDVAIVHRERRGTRWRFEAGSFHVLVTGTKFRAAWNPEDQSFALETREGAVVVSGACLPAARTISAGESLRVSCLSPRPAGAAGGEARSPSATASTAPPAPPSLPGQALGALPAGRRPVAQGARGRDWRDLVAAGLYGDGVRVAERAGFSQICRTANEEELLSLADAARLSGRAVRAIEALGLLRQRFPRSTGAATAAFALGRIAFEQRGAYAEAVQWFGTYIDEMPNGPLAGDAVGRLMEARQRAGDRVRARADAHGYLIRFPEGPYAVAARAILSE